MGAEDGLSAAGRAGYATAATGKAEPVRPLILSGGSGTRLWPLSRGLYPKQFMDMGGECLFAQTTARALTLPDCAPPIVICNEKHRFPVAAVLQEQANTPGLEAAGRASILLEPVGRNTAPAIALGALAALEEGGDPLLLVLSSDHIITPHEAFADAVFQARAGAEAGRAVVFGVEPTGPETGFGYILRGAELAPGVFGVARFVEKPDRAGAAALLAEGGCFWNSGMFMFKASLYLEELAVHAPDIREICLSVWRNRRRDLDFIRFSESGFAACPDISVDYAVMERTDKACMVGLTARWSDMGSWESFYEAASKDESGNVAVGDVVQLQSRNCYLHGSHRLVAALGLDGVGVVETADAVLVLPRSRSQDVKLLLDELKKRGRPETDTHLRVFRPWGHFETLVLGDRFQVKRIVVNPGGVLSLQMHHHRAEHWVQVRGTARVTVDGRERILKEDESTYIPLGTAHRLENPGRIPLEIIEIQTGAYLGEDDIVRFDDVYGREESSS
ncbi:MAG: mannose-1-phosphate guanylyltransferase/mannose-6-phosphate isomerase [Desulfovibrio sp.]|jgi:mannose-1-phosphate guanylyltransferase/mannose-6-phosphate isomerase|nr:mannose-1-phosphate guanylyltransferase/mannose-6-phosphate isomerase [Desulfovibrio sp.]